MPVPALLVLLATGATEAGPSPALVIGARVHVRERIIDRHPYNEIRLQHARLALDFEPTSWLRGQFEAELASTGSLLLGALRDAFVEVRPLPELEIVAGQFKRPFSRIELTSESKLALVQRGIVNDRIIEQLGYGGRDRGAVAQGEIGVLEYAAGIFNGSRAADESDSGKDGGARLELRPGKALRIAAAWSMRYRNPETEPPEDPATHAVGLDGRLRVGPLRVEADLMWAEDWITPGREQLGALVYALWEVPLGDELVLAPLVKAELLDDNLERSRDLAWSLVAGANLHAGEYLRLMLQAEQIASQRGSRVEPERAIYLQIAFDYEHAVGGPR